jgi:hypothetical protein
MRSGSQRAGGSRPGRGGRSRRATGLAPGLAREGSAGARHRLRRRRRRRLHHRRARHAAFLAILRRGRSQIAVALARRALSGHCCPRGCGGRRRWSWAPLVRVLASCRWLPGSTIYLPCCLCCVELACKPCYSVRIVTRREWLPT